MKNIKSLMAVATAAMALTGVAQADIDLTNAPNGNTTVGGTIEKYINFTKVDNTVNLGDLGGPMFGNGGQSYFKSGRSEGNGLGSITFNNNTFPTGNAYNPKGSGDVSDGSEIKWDANTHVGLTVQYGKLFRTDVTNHDGNPNTPDDSLQTRWITTVAGRKVVVGATSDLYDQPGNLIQAVPMPNTGDVVTNTTRYVISPSVSNTQSLPKVEYKFDHGPDSGIKLDPIVKRQGVDDHYGTYQAQVNLTWADLN